MAKYFVKPEHLIPFSGSVPGTDQEYVLVKSLARFNSKLETKPKTTKTTVTKPQQSNSTPSQQLPLKPKEDRKDGLDNEFDLTFDDSSNSSKKDQVSVEVVGSSIRVIVQGEVYVRKTKNPAVAKISAEKLRDGIDKLSVSKLREVLQNTPGMELIAAQ